MTMTRKPYTQTAIVLIIALSAIGGIAAGTASAQEAPDNPLDDNETTAAEDADRGDRYERIDEDVELLDWSYDEDEGVFTLDLRASERSTLTITESVSDTSGSGRMSIEQMRLSEGEQTIQFRVQNPDAEDVALALTTPESIEQGHGTYVSINDPVLPLPSVNLGYGVGIGILVMSVGMSLAVYRKRAVDHKEVESGWT